MKLFSVRYIWCWLFAAWVGWSLFWVTNEQCCRKTTRVTYYVGHWHITLFPAATGGGRKLTGAPSLTSAVTQSAFTSQRLIYSSDVSIQPPLGRERSGPSQVHTLVPLPVMPLSSLPSPPSVHSSSVVYGHALVFSSLRLPSAVPRYFHVCAMMHSWRAQTQFIFLRPSSSKPDFPLAWNSFAF